MPRFITRIIRKRGIVCGWYITLFCLLKLIDPITALLLYFIYATGYKKEE